MPGHEGYVYTEPSDSSSSSSEEESSDEVSVSSAPASAAQETANVEVAEADKNKKAPSTRSPRSGKPGSHAVKPTPLSTHSRSSDALSPREGGKAAPFQQPAEAIVSPRSKKQNIGTRLKRSLTEAITDKDKDKDKDGEPRKLKALRARARRREKEVNADNAKDDGSDAALAKAETKEPSAVEIPPVDLNSTKTTEEELADILETLALSARPPGSAGREGSPKPTSLSAGHSPPVTSPRTTMTGKPVSDAVVKKRSGLKKRKTKRSFVDGQAAPVADQPDEHKSTFSLVVHQWIYFLLDESTSAWNCSPRSARTLSRLPLPSRTTCHPSRSKVKRWASPATLSSSSTAL